MLSPLRRQEPLRLAVQTSEGLAWMPLVANHAERPAAEGHGRASGPRAPLVADESCANATAALFFVPLVAPESSSLPSQPKEYRCTAKKVARYLAFMFGGTLQVGRPGAPSLVFLSAVFVDVRAGAAPPSPNARAGPMSTCCWLHRDVSESPPANYRRGQSRYPSADHMRMVRSSYS